MNHCVVHRAPEAIYFVCSAHSPKRMCSCEYYAKGITKDRSCAFYLERNQHIDYPEFKDTLCACKSAQNHAMLTELQLWQQHS